MPNHITMAQPALPAEPDTEAALSALTNAELERLLASPSAPMLVERYGPAIVPRLSDVAKRAFNRQIVIVFGIIGPFFGGLFFAMLIASRPDLTEWAGDFFLGYFILYLVWIILWLIRYSRHRVLRQAQEQISSIDNVSCLGPLIDVLGEGNETTQKSAYRALMRLLPRSNADILAQLTPKQRDILAEQIGIMAIFSSIEWKIAVLNTLSVVGKTEDLPRVYMTPRRIGSSQIYPELHEASQTCFDKIYARADWGSVSDVGECLSRFSLVQGPNAQITTSGIYNLILERLKLTHLLQQLQLEDRHKLTPKQKRKLYAILKSSVTTSMAQNDILHDAPELTRAGLQAVRQMRDTDAMQAVRALANMEAATANEKTVRADAREALRVLEAEVAREAVSGTLLRASDGPEAASDEMLRAAQTEVSHTEAAQLLRAGTGGGQERA